MIGIIFRRDLHPGARSLSELTENPGLFACDEHLPLAEALEQSWEEDAHFVLYRLVDDSGEQVFARVNKTSPLPAELARAGGRVEVTLLGLDVDRPGHAEWATPEEPLDWLASVPEGLPSPTVWYSTLKGCRFVYVLTRPVPGPEAEGLVLALCSLFASRGIAVDRKCADWTRLFRLPRTTRADSGRQFGLDPRCHVIVGGPELDPASLPHATLPAAEYAGSEAYSGEIPSPEACDALLETPGKSGPKLTEFAKDARKWLKGREAFPVAFEHAKFDPAILAGGWNNAVLKYAGQVTAMLADVDSASPEGCFALLRGALEQLEAEDGDRKPWVQIGWDMVCRMWSQEQSKLVALRARQEQAAAEGAQQRERILETVRVGLPEEVPADPKEAEAWLKRRMIASDGRRHYVMRPDGNYNLAAVGDSMLIPMIRELGMEDTIPVKVLRGHNLVFKSPADILSDFAVPISGVRCSARDRIARVDGELGERLLKVPIHRLNPKLRPAFSPEVDEWLRELFGPLAETGLEWLAHALDVAQPICAINLHGTPGSGKGMLAQGLAECFEGEAPNDGRAMDRFNIGLLRSPVIWCDEGVPEVKSLGSKTDQVFRTFVSGGPMSIEGKMRDVIVADIYPRILIASNSKDILRELIGNRDLTEDDVKAIEQRLLTIAVGPAARRLLTAKGNENYTRGWIAGSVQSNYVVANHIAHLFNCRRPSRTSSGRFLVEGEVQTQLVSDLRLRTQEAQAVLRGLARMLENPAPRAGVHILGGRVWLTVSALTDYMDQQMIGGRNVSMPQVGHVLRQFSMERLPPEVYVPVSQPEGAPKKGRWIEIDLGMLLEQCSRYGLASDRVESLLKLQRGETAVHEARVAGAR